MSDNNKMDDYKKISDEDALAIINTGNALETIALAGEQGISPYVLGVLFRLYPDLIMVNPTFALIKDTDYLENIFRLNRSVIPGMRTLDYEWFDWLLTRDDAEVRQLAASNRTLPSNLYDYCVHSSDRSIRIGFASNPGVSEEYIRMLQDDPDPIVSKIAYQNIFDRENSSLRIVVPKGKLVGGSTTLLQGADFEEPLPVKIDEDIQDNSGALHADKKSHPIVFIAIILSCLCLALVLMNFSKNPKTVATVPVVAEDAGKDAYEKALNLAAKASLESQLAGSPEDVTKAQTLWTQSIAELNTIQPQSSYYSKAKLKIDEYKTKKGLLSMKKVAGAKK